MWFLDNLHMKYKDVFVFVFFKDYNSDLSCFTTFTANSLYINHHFQYEFGFPLVQATLTLTH